MTSKELRKLQNLFNKSIELLELDIESSLFISRKCLELIIHNFFEMQKLAKKESGDDYPILSKMIKKLILENYLGKNLADDMEYIRKKGNDAVHIPDKTAKKQTIKPVNLTIAKGSTQRVGKVIAWYLESANKADNTLFLYAARIGKLPKKNLKQNERVFELSEAIYDLCSYQIFRNPDAIWDITEGIPKSKILDDDIKELIAETERLVWKYNNFEDDFVEGDSRFQNFKNYFSNKKSETAASLFKKINPYQVDEVNRLRKVVKNRYFAN